MNTQPDFVKTCYRCEQPVRLTQPEYLAEDGEFTCCASCKAKINVEADFAGTPISRGHGAESTEQAGQRVMADFHAAVESAGAPRPDKPFVTAGISPAVETLPKKED